MELRFVGFLIIGSKKHPVEFTIPLPDDAAGIERGEAEPERQFVDLSYRAAPAPADTSLPLEIRDHAGRAITLDDLNRGSNKTEMLTSRFPWLYDAEPMEANAPSLATQLQRDLDLVQPHLSKIIQGQSFVYGYQSRIAEALQIPNEGGYRRRIKNVASALLHRYSITTTTTTPPRRETSPKADSEAA